jgi:hypothetical protein
MSRYSLRVADRLEMATLESLVHLWMMVCLLKSSLIALVKQLASNCVLAGFKVLSAVDGRDRRMMASDGGSAEVILVIADSATFSGTA